MTAELLDRKIVGTGDQALEFIQDILESSTEYSVIGKDLEGNILLWNEGARRLYGYEAEEVVGKANSCILHSPEDVKSGRHREIMKIALRDGKWEGPLRHLRKNRELFTARVVITPRLDRHGKSVGFLLISKDISEETRRAEELTATQFYTRSLIESNIDALMTTDLQGILTDVNHQMESLTGCNREELIGSEFKTYFMDPALAEEGIRQALREGKLTNYELTARSPDNRLTVVSCNVSTFRDAEGNLQGVFAAAREITEQSRLQNQLADERAYNRGLIEASLDGLITVDPTINITDVNETMCRMSGYTREELIGSCFADYFTDSKRAAGVVRLTLEKGAVTNYELLLRSKDQSENLVSFNAAIFKDAAGNVLGIFASARDITELRTAESALTKLQHEYEQTLNSVGDGIHGLDLEGNITFENPASFRMLGWDSDDLLGRPAHVTMHHSHSDGSDYPIEHCPIHATLRDGRERRVNDEVFARKDGSLFPVEYVSAPVHDDDGSVRGCVVVFRDISERKRAEAEIHQLNAELEQRVEERTAQLEAANQELEAFSYSVSHDLRSPLRAIDGFAQILEEDYAERLDDEGRRCLKTVQSEALRMGNLIDELLSFSRLGRQDLSATSVDMEAMARSVFANLKTGHMNRPVELILGALPNTAGDPAMLRQVLVNLIGNALKYSSKKDRSVIEIGCDAHDGENAYFVRDNGAGFDVRYIDKLFGVFQRLHSDEEFEGTGVGLALVQRIVFRHGGRVWAESVLGEGATFHFTLKTSAQAPPAV